MSILEIARILSTITTEQWEAILTLSKESTNFSDNIKQINKLNQSKEDKVEEILNLIEIPSYSNGFKYLKEAVLMYMENTNLKIKDILLQLAQKYHTTPGAVRSAIERELMKANAKEVTKMGLKEKITISNMIGIIANHIKKY